MKKTVKIFITFLLIWFMSIVVSNATIRSNDPTVNSGETVSITLTSTQAVQAFKSNISSNGGLTFNSAKMGDFSGKPNGSNASGANPDGAMNLVTYTFTVPKVTTDTKYTVQFSGSISVEGDSWESFSNTSTVTVKAPSTPSNNENNASNNENNANNNKEEEDLPTASDGGSTTTVKSSNNYLKSLKLSTGSISFNKKTTKYTIDVTEETENITITAVAEHEKAIVKGTGKIALQKGTNTINVVVTAENGSARNYQLTVVRPGEEETEEEEELQEEIIVALTSLKLKGVKDNGEIVEIPLTPEFIADIFYYECEVPEGINFIDIEQTCDILDAIVEVTGNENLADGENLINIIIKYTDENNEEQTITYQISATKQASVITQEIMEEEKGLSPLQIGISVGSVIIALVIIVILIVRYRKQQDNEDYDEMDFGGYGEPFYSEDEEEIFEKPIAPLKTKEEKEQEESEELSQEEIIDKEELDNWEEFETVKKKKIFGKNAKKGKHF